MHYPYHAVSELSVPDEKWAGLFKRHWPAYKAWLNESSTPLKVDLKTAQAALKQYMPEMWPTYERLCAVAKTDNLAAKFLTGYQPPAYVSACSNAVSLGTDIQLIRNYDYHPDRIEGTQWLSAWHGKKVMVNSDCLIGALDGMNEDGLAISLTFGGQQTVGKGFGIPFILRYVLEFCRSVKDAIKVLQGIPTHMAYNLTVVDATGQYSTVYLAPNKKARFTKQKFTTNHQKTVLWPENAIFNQSLERSAFLKKLLFNENISATALREAFMQKPLYSTRYNESFGTLYTAVYSPTLGTLEMHWPTASIHQNMNGFLEQFKPIILCQSATQPESLTQ